ncbi:Membrane-bound lytic murein transglycosylase A precursor [Jannaschia seosinensis]|uniref:peptidoglycan lytic exotransglycosylase n=1 Tax=Jannaschia seosinensis TaxID=313367 RepID=A0A0M7BC58_9RHOB|nr:MltA domain-containing protein [Jannaschia seosinensis]CUH39402.1 Membrane-bound lytic murein transglycosylase A precursor [Jannaschia seosinensis]
MARDGISQAAPTGRPSHVWPEAWAADNLDAALTAFLNNFGKRRPDAAQGAADARAFFETHFRMGETIKGHFTGYFEPEIPASLTRSDTFCVPIHAMPQGGCSLPRAQIEPHLAGQEIAWLRDPVDRFFLQVQGSGRLRLAEGGILRVGHAGGNGQSYRSIGKLLIDRGIFGPDIDAARLADWLRADPERGRVVMNENPSYPFFAPSKLPEDTGPIGTLCVVTAGRSLAVDPMHVPLGTPIWIEVGQIARLVIAQDTGSAIVGPGRGDLFFGTGDAAGLAAGQLNHRGRFTPLVPR